MPYNNIIEGIYCIKNLCNNKVYIGQSNNILGRWSGHKYCLNNNKHGNDYLQKAWNKYGEENFEFSIIEQCSGDIIDNREIYWISYYKSTDDKFGYNIEFGGKQNKVVSEDTKLKISIARKGFKHSDETKIKISTLQNGRKLTEEWKKNISQHHINAIKNGDMVINISGLKEYNDSIKKPIKCYDKNGFICNYSDIHTAANDLNIEATNICKVLKHKHKTCGIYTFCYLNESLNEEDLSNRYKKSSPNVSSFKYIEQINEFDEVIDIFKTISEAANKLKLDASSITKVCKGKLKTTNGYRFRYA